jgi:L-fuculose-phosphate aldolase
MHERDARPALVDASQRLEAAGLNHNSSGNLSVRVGDRVLVTPSGIPAHVLRPDDLVLLDADGAPTDDRGRVPTSEWRLHVLLLQRRPDVDAVVHTHSPEATAASTLGRSVPAVHYVIARFGGTDLPCAPYATYGTEELAHHVAATLGANGHACLMANHGAIALGRDLGSAVSLALDVEWLCGVHRRACQLGSPQVLDDDEIARVAERFSRYGQPGR